MASRTTGIKKSSTFSTKRIAILSILVALCYVGRIVFQFLPNVQPMTAILLIITLTYGTRDGMIVAGLSLVLSNLVLGMGPWIFYQLLSYLIMILFTGVVMRRVYQRSGTKWLLVIYAFFSGILYGFVISIFSAKMFGMSNFWAYYLAGLPFDFMHAIGNAGFYLLLEPIIRPIILSSMKKEKNS